MKKVLITGASGMIGSNVLEYLLDNTDWNFVCICSWRHKGNPLRIKPNDRVTVVTHDLTGKIPYVGAFDYILNLASESHVDRSIESPLSFIENNVSSTLQVLEYAREYTPDIFLQFSTDEVFGTNNTSHTIMPSNPYSASKAAQEMICMSYARTYGLNIVITNCNNVIGKYQNKEKFIPKVIDLIKNYKTVQIHTYKRKPGRRYYNDVRNVSAALFFILTKAKLNKNNLTRFGLPGGEMYNNRQMVFMIAEAMGVKNFLHEFVDVEKIRPGYDEYYPLSGIELREQGFSPKYTVKDALMEVVNA